MKLPDFLGTYRQAIDVELRAILDDRPLPLYDMMRYHLGWIDKEGEGITGPAGKSIRPALCLLACEAVSGDFHPALPVAASVELIHNFSLIHDDIQDNDSERRHRATVWSIWGKPQAINAGTAMRILADLAVFRLKEAGVRPEKQLDIQKLLDTATLTLIEGQYLDIHFESRLDVTTAEYLDMIAKKTASLISCSLEAGVLVGCDDKAAAGKFREYGVNAGLAFQIRDDVLGIWGKTEETGKPTGSDIVRKKKTYPRLYALNRNDHPGCRELRDTFQKTDLGEVDVDRSLDILDSVGAKDAAQELVSQYVENALKIVRALDIPHNFRTTLEEVVRFFGNRDL